MRHRVDFYLLHRASVSPKGILAKIDGVITPAIGVDGEIHVLVSSPTLTPCAFSRRLAPVFRLSRCLSLAEGIWYCEGSMLMVPDTMLGLEAVIWKLRSPLATDRFATL